MSFRMSSIEVAKQATQFDDPKVIVPDVFPSGNLHNNVDGLHDIFRGHIPRPAVLENYDVKDNNKGWLRIATPTDSIPAYLDPSLPESLLYSYRSSFRPSSTFPLIVEKVREIKRNQMRLSTALQALEPGYRIPDISLFDEKKPVETVLAFLGTVALGKGQTRVSGIHMPSACTYGWVRIWNERY